MLTAVLPLKSDPGAVMAASYSLAGALAGAFVPGAGGIGVDLRPSLGLHHAAIYALGPGGPLNRPQLGIVTLYDGDFFHYLSAFTTHPTVAAGFDGVLAQMDETGLVDPSDKTSAVSILSHGGCFKRNAEFIKLLNRYNHTKQEGENTLFLIGHTFPGLTARNVLNFYPNAQSLWPFMVQPR
jgi:hypothetical protein